MNRTKFYSKTVVDSVDELDLLHNNLSEFDMNHEKAYYRVTVADIVRPDMISYNCYGTVRYWWIICYVNDVFNPFEELVVGMMLEIPNILDIYDFYKKWRVR